MLLAAVRLAALAAMLCAGWSLADKVYHDGYSVGLYDGMHCANPEDGK